jgi:hypothetical protein
VAIPRDEVLPFTPDLLDRYSEVGETTRRYYASFDPGRPFLLFVGIAHVLYKGFIETSVVRVIEA